MPDTRKWYAVYTKPKWEKKVSQLLTKKKIESYCPLNKVVRQWKDRRKLIMEPLFNSYVFVHLTEQEIWSVRQTEGVLNFVYWLSKPAIIQDQEIITIQRFLNDYQNVHLEKARVNPHDTVRVMGGPLMYLEGNVLEVKNKTVKVLLPSLGYHMVAELSITNVEKVLSFNNELTDMEYPSLS